MKKFFGKIIIAASLAILVMAALFLPQGVWACDDNMVCGEGETYQNCPLDCACNKNGQCEEYLGENIYNCLADCQNTKEAKNILYCGQKETQFESCGNAQCEKSLGETGGYKLFAPIGDISMCAVDCGSQYLADNGTEKGLLAVRVSLRSTASCGTGEARIKIYCQEGTQVKCSGLKISYTLENLVDYIANSASEKPSQIFIDKNKKTLLNWEKLDVFGYKEITFRFKASPAAKNYGSNVNDKNIGSLVIFQQGGVAQSSYPFFSGQNHLVIEPCQPQCSQQVCNYDGKCDLGNGENFGNCQQDCGQFKDFSVITLEARDVTDNSAVIRGSIPGIGSVSLAKYYLSYYVCDEKLRGDLHSSQSSIALTGQTSKPTLFEVKLDYLFPGTKYCFEALAQDVSSASTSISGGQKEFTTLLSANGLLCPTFISPINSTKIQTLTPALRWNNALGGGYYRYALFKDYWNSVPAIDAQGTASTSASISSGKLIWARQYVWSINVCKDATMSECSGWCAPTSFITGDILAMPKIKGPIGDITSTQPTIAWELVPGGNYYEWIIESDSKIVQNGLIQKDFVSTTKPLIKGDYVLKVRACSDQQMLICSEYSEVKFSIKANVDTKCDTLKIASTSSKVGYFMFCANGKAWPCDDGALFKNEFPGTSDYLYDQPKIFDENVVPGEFFAEYTMSSPYYEIILVDMDPLANGKEYKAGEALPSNHRKYKLAIRPNSGIKSTDVGGQTYQKNSDIFADLFPHVGSIFTPSVTPEIKSKYDVRLPVVDAKGNLTGLIFEGIFGLAMDNPLFNPELKVESSDFNIEKNSNNGEVILTVKERQDPSAINDTLRLSVLVPRLDTFQTVHNLWFNKGCVDGQENFQEAEFRIGEPTNGCYMEENNCFKIICSVQPTCTFEGQPLDVSNDATGKQPNAWYIKREGRNSGVSCLADQSSIKVNDCDASAPPMPKLSLSQVDYCTYPVILNFGWQVTEGASDFVQTGYKLEIERPSTRTVEGSTTKGGTTGFGDTDIFSGVYNVKSIKVFASNHNKEIDGAKGELKMSNCDNPNGEEVKITVSVRGAKSELFSPPSEPIVAVLPCKPRPIPYIPKDKYVVYPQDGSIAFFGEINPDQINIVEAPNPGSWTWYKGFNPSYKLGPSDVKRTDNGIPVEYYNKKLIDFSSNEPIEAILEFEAQDTIKDPVNKNKCQARIKLMEGTDVIFSNQEPQI